MSDAADVVRRRAAINAIGRSSETNRKIHEFQRRLQPFATRAAARLCELDYPEAGCRQSVVKINGQERVLWELYREQDGGPITYLCDDGTLWHWMQDHRPLESGAAYNSLSTESVIAHVIERLESLANYRKAELKKGFRRRRT